MSLASDLVAKTRSYLLSPVKEPKNRLNGSVTSGATTWTLEFDITDQISAGDVLACELELVLVWSVSGQVVTVQRGWDGTTTAAHADDAIVTVNPSFSDFHVFSAINDDLADISAPATGLFQMKTVELTFNSATAGYDLTSVTDVNQVYEVRYDDAGSQKRWPIVDDWRLARNSETDDFASGFQIVVNGYARSGAQLRVLYKAPYSQLSTLADDVQTVSGLSVHADDIPCLGAAYRLVTVRETARNLFEYQGDTRRAEEVPAGAQLRSGSGLFQLRQQRISAEASRLAQQFPTRRRGL